MPVIGNSSGLEISPLGVSPLTIVVTLGFVVLHLVSGVMLDRSHASPAIEPAAFAALEDQVKCSAEARQRQTSPTNVWSLGAD
jgi:hypothetical protein